MAQGATLDAATYLGSANGLGGAGGSGSSGAGDGGSALSGSGVATIDGVATLSGPFENGSGFVVTSFAQGGDGTSGGSATAGSSSIVVNGSLSSAGTLQASASAMGGQGSDNGGDAQAGSASITINGGASAATLFIITNAVGGDGSIAGGNASAGTATLAVNDGSLNITDFGSVVEADAIGGTGASSIGTAGAGTASVSSFNGGDITALSLIIEAEGDVGTGSVGISAGSDCDCSPGSINATDLSLFSSNNINVPTIGTDITVDGRLSVESDLNIAFADVTAGVLEFDAGGDVTGNNIIVSDLDGNADGSVTLGNITAGPDLPADPSDFSVGITAGNSITVGDVSGAGRVGFATFGPLTTGDINAGDLFMALVGGDVSLGSVTTALDGEVYIGDVSMFLDAGGPDNFDASLVLAQTPVMTGGSITINGPVTTGIMEAAAGTDLILGSVTAGHPSTSSRATLPTSKARFQHRPSPSLPATSTSPTTPRSESTESQTF